MKEFLNDSQNISNDEILVSNYKTEISQDKKLKGFLDKQLQNEQYIFDEKQKKIFKCLGIEIDNLIDIERDSNNRIIKIEQGKGIYTFEYKKKEIAVNIEGIGGMKCLCFDYKGNVVKYFHDEGDLGEYNVEYEYDKKSNIIREQYNYLNGKQINFYEYDNFGRIIEKKYDFEGDGEINAYVFVKYDKSGNVIEERFDNDGDGKVDEIVNYNYDDEGNVIEERFDNDGDGKIDEIVNYSYDDEGNVIDENLVKLNKE